MVKPAGDLASEFHMCDLVFADGNESCFVDENVSGLKDRISEEPVGAEVLGGEVLLLLFIRGNALEPPERSDHREEQMQDCVLRHVRLHEHGAACGVEAAGE